MRYLRIQAVVDRTGLSRASIYRLAKLGEFPKPVKLTGHASGWVEDEVEAHNKARVAARDAVS